MNFEIYRLNTFQDWPANSPITKERLAKAGFYYISETNSVKCFHCGVEINNWNYGDQAAAKHKKLNPHCVFIQNPEITRNVSFEEVNPTSLKSYCVRLKTFSVWSFEHVIKGQDLAAAGFYNLNVGMKTKCAFCDCVVGYWEKSMDISKKHKSGCEMSVDDMSKKKNRLLSFVHWPKSNIIDAERLVDAGFYYLGKGM